MPDPVVVNDDESSDPKETPADAAPEEEPAPEVEEQPAPMEVDENVPEESNVAQASIHQEPEATNLQEIAEA